MAVPTPEGRSTPAAASAVEQASRARTPKQGYLPVSEFAFDRPGGPSPFGDDLTFPLPVEQLRYRHG